jgi:hypothetical protein
MLLANPLSWCRWVKRSTGDEENMVPWEDHVVIYNNVSPRAVLPAHTGQIWKYTLQYVNEFTKYEPINLEFNLIGWTNMRFLMKITYVTVQINFHTSKV